MADKQVPQPIPNPRDISIPNPDPETEYTYRLIAPGSDAKCGQQKVCVLDVICKENGYTVYHISWWSPSGSRMEAYVPMCEVTVVAETKFITVTYDH